MDLWSRITKIKSVIEKNKDKINNETTTRYVLIDPVLRDLGWILDDPNQVRYEEGTDGRWDYNLGNRLLIEAKKLNGIKSSDGKQLIKYLRNNNIEHGVLTDGNVWQKWNVTTNGENQNFATAITTSTLDNIYNNLNKLRKAIIMTTITPIDNSESRIDNVQKSPKKVIVSDFIVPKKLPVQLFCKDNPPILCEHWINILEGVAIYLIDNNIIDNSDCPIPSGGPKTAILNTTNRHQTGSLMKSCKQVRPGFYINANLSSQRIILNTKKIIDYSGLSLDDFKIKSSSSSSLSTEQNDYCNVLEFQTEGKLPAKILYPDGSSSAVCTAWRHILFQITEYLVDKNYITRTNYPTFGTKNQIITPSTPLFNQQHYHQNMKNGFYIYKTLDKKGIFRNIVKLLKYAKLDTNDFTMCSVKNDSDDDITTPFVQLKL